MSLFDLFRKKKKSDKPDQHQSAPAKPFEEKPTQKPDSTPMAEVIPKSKPALEPTPEPKSAPKPTSESKPEAKAEPKLAPEPAPKPTSASKPEAKAEPKLAQEPAPKPTSASKPEPKAEPKPAQNIKSDKKASFFNRLKGALSKTRQGFSQSIASAVLGKKIIDEDLLEEIETILITSDLGIDTSELIIQALTKQLSRHQLQDSSALLDALKQQLLHIIKPCQIPLTIDTSKTPYVILMVGINGAGKTTTIGKLAKHLQKEGKTVMLAAGDTFRAAAVEQLCEWGARNTIPVVAQHTGADSASVIYDALTSAKSRHIDVLIADTAGRLHTKQNLMEELKKIVRVMKKIDEDAPHEVMLVLDAGTGQNALNQAQQFHDAVALDGITITKLDGTARGGMLFAIASQLTIPIRFIGVGEHIDDLRPFNADDFVAALFEHDTMTGN